MHKSGRKTAKKILVGRNEVLPGRKPFFHKEIEKKLPMDRVTS